MKKGTMTILLILVFAIALFTSCSKKNSKDTLKVAIDLKYPPFMFLDDQGNPAGFEADISKAFGEYLGKDVKIINTDFSMLVPALETGEADIVISDMAVTEARKQKVDFSDGYRYTRKYALVNKDFYEKNNITDSMTPEEFFALPGIKCIGLSGTVSVKIPQGYGAPTEEVTEIGSALMEIRSGQSNVLIGSYEIFGYQAANQDTTIIHSGLPEYVTSAFAVKKGNTELLNQANAFIKTLYEDGGLYDQLAQKYDEDVHKYLFNENYGLKYLTEKPKQE